MAGHYDEPCILVHPAVEHEWLRGIIFRKLMTVDRLTWHEAVNRLDWLDVGPAFGVGEEEAVGPKVRLFGHDWGDENQANPSESTDLADQAGPTGPVGWVGIGSFGGSFGGVAIALLATCALLALS
jgi:hypothetical protein